MWNYIEKQQQREKDDEKSAMQKAYETGSPPSFILACMVPMQLAGKGAAQWVLKIASETRETASIIDKW